MKLSWTSIKISIAGAKLSHLVQKDKIWDHGSMAEQTRIIFFLVQKAKGTGNVESLKKQCTISCFEKLKTEIGDEKSKIRLLKNPIIKELAVIEVSTCKNNSSDKFSALIKGFSNIELAVFEHKYEFSEKWSFVRQGEWWLLNEIKSFSSR